MNPIIVGMNKADISTKEQPIIGTQALGPCVGVLIHSNNSKRSVVLHTSTDWEEVVAESLVILVENELISWENLNKVLTSLDLHRRFDLYNFDNKTKLAILKKKGLLIDKVAPEETLEVTIIPGYYKDNYDVALNLTKFFLSLSPLFVVKRNDLPKKAVRVRMFDDLGSQEFFFDSSSGKFVTEKVKDNIDNNKYRL